MHYYYWRIQRCLNAWLVCCVTLLLPAWFIAVAVKLNPLYSAFILVSYWHFSLTSGQQLAWYKGETAAGLWMKEMAWKTIGWKRGFLGQSVWPVKGLMGNKMLLALCHSLLLLSRLWGERGKGQFLLTSLPFTLFNGKLDFHGRASECRGTSLNGVSISFLMHHYEKMFSA